MANSFITTITQLLKSFVHNKLKASFLICSAQAIFDYTATFIQLILQEDCANYELATQSLYCGMACYACEQAHLEQCQHLQVKNMHTNHIRNN